MKRQRTSPSKALLPLALLSAQALAQSNPLPVTVSDPTTCSPMTVSWDASAGQAPWTVTVAPLGHVPTKVQLASGYSANAGTWSWSWNVPDFTGRVERLIVAVSDASDAVSGTSALMTVKSGTGNCAASADEQLDFIWYTPKSSPEQCHDWKITFQEEKGNLGLEPPVDILILPVEDRPTRLYVTSSRASSVDWMVNYRHGMEFAIAAFDQGRSGTGGVGGDLYKVSTGSRSTCLGEDQREAVLGLPAPILTVASGASVATASKMETVRASATRTDKATASATNQSTTAKGTEDEEKKSNAGVIGGAVGGILGALALTGALAWAFVVYLRNRREEDNAYGGKVAKGTNRWSAGGSGNIVPFTSGRKSAWRHSAQVLNNGSPYANIDDQPMIGRNYGVSSSIGHGSSASLHRGRDSFSTGQVSVRSHPTSVHSVVPDDALFPPPPPLPISRAFPSQNSPTFGPVSPSQFKNSPEPFADGSGKQHPSTRDSMAALAGLPLSPSSAYRSLNVRETKPQLISRGSDEMQNPAARINEARARETESYDRRPFDPYVQYNSEAAQYRHPSSRAKLNVPDSTYTPPASPGGGPRYADPREGAARLRDLEDQLLKERKRVISTVSIASSSGGLPYM